MTSGGKDRARETAPGGFRRLLVVRTLSESDPGAGVGPDRKYGGVCGESESSKLRKLFTTAPSRGLLPSGEDPPRTAVSCDPLPTGVYPRPTPTPDVGLRGVLFFSKERGNVVDDSGSGPN